MPDTEIEEILEDLVPNPRLGDSYIDPKYRTQNIKTAHTQLLALQNKARIEELEKLNTHRHYGKDYQESMDELAEHIENRITALQAHIDKGGE